MCGVAYAMTEIPPPNEAAKSQATVVQWRDGSKMATLGAQKRFHVELSRIPDHLEKAVLSAENRDFYEQPLGIAPTGIARALWVNLTSGELQGGSTITQQFAQSMYLDTGRTLAIKFQELFLTLKLEQKMSKDEIFEGYLNTIYLGRGGVYGVEAASRAYFHKSVHKLTVSESAFLAAVLNSPGNYDPYDEGKIDKEARQAAVGRWQYVIDGMVERGWLSPAKAAQLKFPKIHPARDDGETYGGTRGYILKRVESVLKNQMGFTKKEIFTGGLTVRTTLDKQMQRDAKRAVERTLPKNWPYNDVETGLVSVKPGTGEVRAMYGGKDYLEDQYGNVFRSEAQVGSSFKPYVLAAALEQDIGLRSRFKGDSPQRIRGQKYKNSGEEGGTDYGMVNLVGATAHSVNTAYVRLGFKVGLSNVHQAAVDAGLSQEKVEANTNGSLFLGSVSLHPVDQAAAMATFANKGVAVEPHLVRDVRGPRGEVLHKVEPERHRAFSEEIAADVSYAMQKVLEPGGTAADHGLDGRPSAGKTGTVEDNKAAWFVGYTPQLSTAVAMFNPTKDGGVGKLVNVGGYGAIEGSTLPAPIWEAFMEGALRGKPVKPLPEPEFLGETLNPAPTKTPSPSPTRTGPSPGPTRTSPTPGPTTSTPEPSSSMTVTPTPGEPPDDPGRPGEPGEPTPGDPGDGDACFPFCSDEETGGGEAETQQDEDETRPTSREP